MKKKNNQHKHAASRKREAQVQQGAYDGRYRQRTETPKNLRPQRRLNTRQLLEASR
jgi:hypothetical protein